MHRLPLIFFATMLKIIASLVLGLLMTNEYIQYTSFVSRTHELTASFLLYIFLIDVISLCVLAHLTNIFFNTTQKINMCIRYAFVAMLIMCMGDVFFIIQVKADQVLLHVFIAIILLLNKYMLLFLISLYSVLKMHQVKEGDRTRIFVNYQTFKYKKLIPKKLFFLSDFLSRIPIMILIFGGMMFYVNCLSLQLYADNWTFYLNVIICSFILLYLTLITLHQHGIILAIYKTHVEKEEREAV